MEVLTETDLISSERAMLVRICARCVGDPDVAEDLAQQTLLEAWRHAGQLRDPHARQTRLFSIARNVCRGWARSQGRVPRLDLTGTGRQRSDEWLADDVDLELELDRNELAALLDRAMALLPPDVRQVLLWRSIEESPQADVAARLGLTEGAVEARLQRGKRRLKRLLTTELSDEAISYGLISPLDAGWQETRLWCPGCGVIS